MKRALFGRLRYLTALWLAGSVVLASVAWACLQLGLGFATTALVVLNLITLLAVAGLVRRLRRLGELHAEQTRLIDLSRRNQETYLAEAQQLSHTGSFGWNVATGEIFWSEQSFRIFGYEPDSRPSIDMMLQRVHPDDLAPVRRIIARAVTDGKDFDFEHRLLMPDGLVKHLHVVAHGVTDGSGKPSQFMGALMDVTARKNAEAAVRSSEQRYRYLFHYMPIGLWQLDARGVAELFRGLRAQGVTDLAPYLDEHPDFLYRIMGSLTVEEVNEEAVKLFGARDQKEMLGPATPFWRRNPDTFRRAMESRFRGQALFQEETKFLTFDAREIDALFTAARLGGIGELGMSLVGVIDITERIRAQERLQQVQAEFAHAARISVLGELAASIAHEVNQPLAAITTNTEAGLRWLDRPEPNVAKTRELMQRIVNDARRAAGIVARMRAMAAGRAPQPTTLSLDRIIEESVVFLRNELQSKEVAIVLDLAPALPALTGDRTQLQQVIVNLAINAAQAMASAGAPRRILAIRTTLAMPDTLSCTLEDSGPGISPDQLARIFDSFFTTKAGGMGLGLSISRSIIEAHGGRIRADNESRYGGARFTFTLPAALAEAA